MSAPLTEDNEELNLAAQMIIDMLPPGTTVMICSPDMEVTHRAEYKNGTAVWTVKKIDRPDR